MKKYLLPLIICIFSPFISEGKDQAYEAWLHKEIIDSQLKITACCKNNTSEKANIILKITAEKRGKAGTSKTIQSSGVILNADEQKCFSKIVFNLYSGDEYKVILEAYKDNQIIAKDSILKGNKNE